MKYGAVQRLGIPKWKKEWSAAKVCSRSGAKIWNLELSKSGGNPKNDDLVSKFGVATAESEPSELSDFGRGCLDHNRHVSLLRRQVCAQPVSCWYIMT